MTISQFCAAASERTGARVTRRIVDTAIKNHYLSSPDYRGSWRVFSDEHLDEIETYVREHSRLTM